MTLVSHLSDALRIGVLRGGPSSEYDSSLESGKHVLQELRETHEPLDIFISKDGRWHSRGVERPAHDILRHVDVVFNALHGAYGEDGSVQNLLEYHGIPYTGSDKLSSAIAMNKFLSKTRAARLDIQTPVHVLIRRDDDIRQKSAEVFASIPHPLVVKPVNGSSSLGLYVVQSLSDLSAALDILLAAYPAVLVEEYISGREVSCVTVSGLRGIETYVFPAVEIRYPSDVPVWTNALRRDAATRIAYPSTLLPAESTEVMAAAQAVHQGLGLSHYAQSDFIVSPRRGVYFLETNTLPRLAPGSIVHESLASTGISLRELIHHSLSLALAEK